MSNRFWVIRNASRQVAHNSLATFVTVTKQNMYFAMDLAFTSRLVVVLTAKGMHIRKQFHTMLDVRFAQYLLSIKFVSAPIVRKNQMSRPNWNGRLNAA